ncbi:MAG: hypothetical protein ACR2GP_07955, partial [Burkholderiaceae bacterium]
MTKHRRPLAWLLFVALLFTQVANAAYACTRNASVAGDELAAFSTTETAFALASDCEATATVMVDHDLGIPPLCVDHCVHGAQASADAHVLAMHWLPASLLGVFLVVPAIAPAHSALPYWKPPGMGGSIVPSIPLLLGCFLSWSSPPIPPPRDLRCALDIA